MPSIFIPTTSASPRSTGREKDALGSSFFSRGNKAFGADTEKEAQNRISDFSNLLDALTSLQNSDFWTINRDGKVFFFDLALHCAPAVRSSVIVSSDLHVEVFFGETRLSMCGDVFVPDKLCDLSDLKAVLQTIEEFHRSICTEPSQKIRNLLQLVATLLDEVSGEHFACKLQDWHLEVLKFLKREVALVFKQC